MTEAEKRMHRCCFTGHRPEKLARSEEAIKADLEKAIRQAIAEGLDVFITGMAIQPRGSCSTTQEITAQKKQAKSASKL